MVLRKLVTWVSVLTTINTIIHNNSFLLLSTYYMPSTILSTLYIYYTPVTTLTLFHYRGHKLYEDHGTSKWQSMRSENTIPSISSTTSTAIAMQISLWRVTGQGRRNTPKPSAAGQILQDNAWHQILAPASWLSQDWMCQPNFKCLS